MSSRFILPFADVGSGIKPSSGAKLFFYALDGVTLKDTYSDQLTTPTPNSNPVIADSTGVFGDIYITGQYKVTLTDKDLSQIFGGAIVNEVMIGNFSDDIINELINDLSQAYEFATVAAYKAFTTAFPVGKTINLLDRTASFTVISGTGTSNTYDIVASDQVAQSISYIKKGRIDPIHLGADPANTIDSTGEFNAASTLGVIQYSAGTFKISGTILLLNSMYSDDKKNCILDFDGADGLQLGANDITISDCGLFQATGVGRFKRIPIGSFTNITIKRNKCEGFQVGRRTTVALPNDGAGIGAGSVIRHNEVFNITDIDAFDGDGIVVNVGDIKIYSNIIYDVSSEGIKSGGSASSEVHIHHNDVRRSGRDGIDVYNGGRNCYVSFNTLIDNTEQGIEVKYAEDPQKSSDCVKVSVTNNIISGGLVGIAATANKTLIAHNTVNSNVAIRAGGTQTNVIGNIIEAQLRGIDVKGIRDGSLSGNVITMTVAAASVTDSRPIMVGSGSGDPSPGPTVFYPCIDLTIIGNNIDGGGFAQNGVVPIGVETDFVNVTIDKSNKFKGLVIEPATGVISPVADSPSTGIYAADLTGTLVVDITADNDDTLSGIVERVTVGTGESITAKVVGEFTTAAANEMRIRIETTGSAMNFFISAVPMGKFELTIDLVRVNATRMDFSYNGSVADFATPLSGYEAQDIPAGTLDRINYKYIMRAVGGAGVDTSKMDMLKIKGVTVHN